MEKFTGSLARGVCSEDVVEGQDKRRRGRQELYQAYRKGELLKAPLRFAAGGIKARARVVNIVLIWLSFLFFFFLFFLGL